MGKIKELTPREYNKIISLIRKKDKTVFSVSEESALNLNLVFSAKKSFKNRIRRYFQTMLNTQKRIENTPLKTNIGVTKTTFKNKTIIEVSNPQTDYKFYKRL
jgi:hypothetical protein